MEKVKSKKDVILDAQKKKKKVHFATLMDVSHLKNAELESKHQKYKGRVVLRGDSVKDDSGAYAVFTEQGSSVTPKSKWRTLQGCLEIPKSECPEKMDTSSTTQFAQIMVQTWKTLWFISIEICTVTRSLASCGKDDVRRFYWDLDGEKVLNWECMFVHRRQGLFLSEDVDDIKMAGTKENMAPTWKKLVKLVDLGEPTSCLDHVYLGCTQRECEANESIMDRYREMFESRISAAGTEKPAGWEKPHAKTVAWSYDMEGHAQTCVERYCELANNKTAVVRRFNSLLGSSQRRKTWKQLANCPPCVLKLS